MAHKTTDEENYSGIIEDGFEAYTVAFDEIVSFVKENRGKKLDLTIRFEDFLAVKTEFSTVLEKLCGLELPEKSLILRLPIGLTHFEDEKLSGKYPFSELEQSRQIKSFIYKIVLPTTFSQAIRFDKNAVALVVPSTLKYIVAQDLSRGEAIWNDGKNGYETYTVQQKYVELNEYAFVFDNIASSYESDFDIKPFANPLGTPMAAPAACAPLSPMLPDVVPMTCVSKPFARKFEASNNISQEKLKSEQKKNPVASKKLSKDNVSATYFAPPLVKVGKSFPIRVVISPHKDFATICAKYNYVNKKSNRKTDTIVKFRIAKGTKIGIKVTLNDSDGNRIVSPRRLSKIWEKQNIDEEFEMIIPESYSKSKIFGKVEFFVNGKSFCEQSFEIAVFKIFNDGLKTLINILKSVVNGVAVSVIANFLTTILK